MLQFIVDLLQSLAIIVIGVSVINIVKWQKEEIKRKFHE